MLGNDQAVMPGKPRKRELQEHLARSLRPAIDLFGLLETFQLATNIDQDAGEFRPNRLERAHNPLLGGDGVIGESGGMRWRTAPRAARRRKARPVRSDARTEMGVPIIGTQAFTGFVLLIRDQRADGANLQLAPTKPMAYREGPLFHNSLVST